SEANQGYRSGLLAAKADDALSPVNILGFEVSQIGLRRAQVPGHLIKGLPFEIGFAGNDCRVFLPRDGSLLFEMDCWPLFLGYHRPRQPGHIESEVVNAAQKDVRGDSTTPQRAKEMLGPGFGATRSSGTDTAAR